MKLLACLAVAYLLLGFLKVAEGLREKDFGRRPFWTFRPTPGLVLLAVALWWRGPMVNAGLRGRATLPVLLLQVGKLSAVAGLLWLLA